MNADFEEALGRGFLEAVENEHDYATVHCSPSERLTYRGRKDWDDKVRNAMGVRVPKHTYFFRVSEIDAHKEEASHGEK